MALPSVSKDTAEAIAQSKYFHSGPFSHARVRADFLANFQNDPRFNADSADDLETLLGFIENDSRVTDIRWMAYMLATAYWETSHRVPELIKVKDPKTKKLVTKEIMKFRNMAPAEETGHGKFTDKKGKVHIQDYYEPVKVRRMADGSAIVTEHDGDQWKISKQGYNAKVQPGVKLGAPGGAEAAKNFTEDTGDEHAYYGRGYSQLTWWDNYARNGAAIGEGLNLLFEPERAMEPKIAYEVMVVGMLKGVGFAHGHTFSKYFHGSITNYVGARDMVNSGDHPGDIADIAQMFEDILLKNKVGGGAVAGAPAGASGAAARLTGAAF